MDAGVTGVFKLSRWQLFAYGQLVVPMAVIGLPLAIYIPPFYSGTLGLNLAAVGFILMLARLSDVFTDPFIGRWSDRTHTRWGRRRPWVALGVVVMMVSSVMLFMPPVAVSNLYLLGWIAATRVSPRPAYAGVVEHSVYVHPGARGRGVASALLKALIESTEAAGLWTIQSGIFPENTASLAVHARAGFRVIGTRERIGRHHGRWRDVVLVERRSPVVD